MPNSPKDYYVLTVHYYPGVIERGEIPIEATGYPIDYSTHNPNAYRSHSFSFDKPPSRLDFLDTCYSHLPWTSVWSGFFDLLKAKSSPWPMLSSVHKASSAQVLDKKGIQVGHIELSRHFMYQAGSYDRTDLWVNNEVRRPFLHRVPKDKRVEADRLIDRNVNLILENAAEHEGENGNHVANEIEKLLTTHGFIRKGSRNRQTV